MEFLKSKSSLVFQPKMRCNPKFVGCYNDNIIKEELFYFGDPVTAKRIDFFTLTGVKKLSIPLDSSSMKIGGIKHFQIISIDTVLVFSEHSGKIAIINSKGNVWKYWDLAKDVKPYNNFNLTYTTPYTTSFVSRDSVYLHVGYISSGKGIPSPQAIDYFKESLLVPYMIRVFNVYGDTLRYEYGIDSFYLRFMTFDKAMTELTKHSLVNNRIIINSQFSDSLYLYNMGMDLESAFKVSSKFSDVRIEPVELTSNEEFFRYGKEVVPYGGSIERVVFIPSYNVYMIEVMLSRKQKAKSPYEFSFLLYKSNGQKIGEQRFSSKIYKGNYYYYSNGKIYISNDADDVIKSGTYNFDVYEISI